MKLFSTLSSALILTTCLASHSLWAESEPEEQTITSISRNASSGNLLTGDLSKNLMKTIMVQEPYIVKVPYEAQENYTVKVPYEAQENYTVDIPYQATEQYTEQVPYQDTEQYTEQVPYQTTEQYTDYETDYRDEYKCHNVTKYRNECRDVTRYRQQCHNEVQCRQVPGSPNCREVEECGTNALGQPICKTRRVCEGGSSEQRCENRNVCENEPYNERVCSNEPYTDQECRNERVSYERPVTRTRTVTKYRSETRTRTVTKYRSETRTRTVTKYRQETRTRTVTKYRDETRTRTVTKYRDEEKCCKSVSKIVFDRQLQFHVEVVFPSDAIVGAGQVETMDVILVSADAKSAKVELQNVIAKNRYYIAKQQAVGATIRVELAVQPKDILSDSDLAVLSDNSKLSVVANPQTYANATLTIVDSLPAFRDVISSYEVSVDVVKNDGSILVGDTRTWSRDELKAANGVIRMMDVYKDQTRALNSLGMLMKIKFSVKAKRGGPSPILAGKNIQAAQEGLVTLK